MRQTCDGLNCDLDVTDDVTTLVDEARSTSHVHRVQQVRQINETPTTRSTNLQSLPVKNVKNRSIIGEDIDKSKVTRF